MRKLFIALFVVMLICSEVLAADKSAPGPQPIEAQTAAAEANYNILTGTTIKLEQERQRIARVKLQVIEEDKAVKSLESERDRKERAQKLEDPSLHSDLADVNLRIDNYKRKCTVNGQPKRYDYYPSQGLPREAIECEEEYKYLQPRMASVYQRLDEHKATDGWLNRTNIELTNRKRAVSKNTLENFENEKANRAAIAENDAAMIAAKIRLDKLKTKNDKCKTAIASGNKRQMKAVCGEMFDNNTGKPETPLTPSRGVVVK